MSVQPTPEQAAAASQWATLLLVLLLLGIVLVVSLVLVVLVRRRTQTGPRHDETHDELPNAWEESGRRTPSPSKGKAGET